MRNTDSLPTLGSDQLANITGGCGKKAAPPPQQPQPQQMAAPPPPEDRGVSVTVATGAAASQLIGGAGR